MWSIFNVIKGSLSFFLFYLQMERSSQLLSNPLFINYQSSVTNSTAAAAMTASVFVVTPVGFDTKLILFVLFLIVGVSGLVGNILILYFLSKKKSVPFLQSSSFLRNFDLYMKSLALSDILSCSISVPLASVEIMYDVFQSSWPCRTVRYISVTFTFITINNLIAISTERFLSTRAVPKTFSFTSVRKIVYAAWIAGLIVALAPAATMNGIRYHINGTHYTVVCKPDTRYLPYRATVVSVVLIQYFLPSIALIGINIILARRVWKRRKRRVDVLQDNAIRARMRSHQIKTTNLLIIVTLAFVIPYCLLLYYSAYVAIVKPPLDVQVDFVLRYSSAVLIFSNSAVNFVIYLIQMKDFRVFLKQVLCCKGYNA